MKVSLRLLTLALFVSISVSAQDEGNLEKRERVARSGGLFISGGPSFTLGKNIGDYSTGLNFEAGFLKRVDRAFSVGGSLSYSSFKYDPEKTGFNNAFIGGPYQDAQGDYYHEALYYDLEGGDLGLISAALNLKLNFIPVNENSVISIYGFAKPFITYATRGEITGIGTYLVNYYDIYNGADWEVVDQFNWESGDPYVSDTYGIEVSDKLEEDTRITGGIFIGPGIEFFPGKAVSGFFQVSIGYTLPVSFISTESYENDENYGNDLDVFLEEIDAYPTYETGFPSVNLQFGISFNF